MLSPKLGIIIFCKFTAQSNLMKKKLIEIALVSSPILSVYAVLPLYIFDKMNFDKSLMLCMGVTLHMFVFWALNIFLMLKFKPKYAWQFHGLSFLLVMLLHVPKMFIHPSFSFVPVVDEYLSYPIVITIAANAIILIICNLMMMSEKKKNADLEIQQLKTENLEAQKQMLSQQLHPHFLFNALSVLKSLIGENPHTAQDYVLKLSDFLRYTVNANHSELVSLQQELDFVNNYIELQKIRFEHAFEFQVELPSEIMHAKIPVFALQTLVENAFKHNYFTSQKPLHISLSYADGQISLSNPKLSPKLVARNGAGLKNLNKRYALMSNKNIEITETDTHFRVSLYLI
jgi:two-component system, LytTR family, sensor kinase